METFLGDLRYAARGLTRTPAFSAIAVVSLANRQAGSRRGHLVARAPQSFRMTQPAEIQVIGRLVEENLGQSVSA